MERNEPIGRWVRRRAQASRFASGVAEAYADYGLVARPGEPPAARYVARYLPAILVIALALLGFVLLLTPTGSLPSPGRRWWVRVTAAAPVVALLAITLAPRSFDWPYRPGASPLDLSGFGGPLSWPAAAPAATAQAPPGRGRAASAPGCRRA
jgi:hypothetical protein